MRAHDDTPRPTVGPLEQCADDSRSIPDRNGRDGSSGLWSVHAEGKLRDPSRGLGEERMEVVMKAMGALSVCLMGLLWAGMSLGADCTALPSDSTFRLECERSRKGAETPEGLQTQLMSAPAAQQGQQARHRPWAEDAPPIRKRVPSR
jgi:hypothetical protein